jgi:predicted nucleic acid-binding protein
VKIISNTGPIIGLAKIDKLSLLNDLAEEILIPPLVYRELGSSVLNLLK